MLRLVGWLAYGCLIVMVASNVLGLASALANQLLILLVLVGLGILFWQDRKGPGG